MMADDPPSPPPVVAEKPLPQVILVIGMAGSGKTTLLQRLEDHLLKARQRPYIVNLDPAVHHLPFHAHIDIRDTVDYKKVMEGYGLGPNGAILTALNLFTTKFDQVLDLVERRSQEVSHILVDTPGQIEIFTWSASGSIITDALAASYPSLIAYIVDTPRSASPATFMSNMLYACSILYKTRLPFILVFNKTDVEPCQEQIEWMRDFEAFQAALSEVAHQANGEPGFQHSLMNSMSLMLEEFYNHLKAVGISAMTGEGCLEFFKACDEARVEYHQVYRPELDQLIKERREKEEAEAEAQGASATPQNGAQEPSMHTRLDREFSRLGFKTMAADVEDEDEPDGEVLDAREYAELKEMERLQRQRESGP